MIQLEVWGKYALFTRPELKVERVSYDVPTPSAARGIVESIYYHPGLQWHIKRIYVMNPIRFLNVRRNEVKNKILSTAARKAAQGSEKPLYQVTSQEIVQRASLLLRDVHYVIEAHFTMTEKAAPTDNPGNSRTLSLVVWNAVNAFKLPILAAGNSPLTFAAGQVARFPPFLKRGTWG